MTAASKPNPQAELERLQGVYEATLAAVDIAQGAEAEAAASLTEVDSLETAVALGERHRNEVDELRQAAKDALETARADLARHQAALQGMPPLIEAATRAAAAETLSGLVDKQRDLDEQRARHEAQLAEGLTAAVDAARELTELRERQGRLLREMSSVAQQAGQRPVEPADEIGWRPDGWEALAAVLQTGPSRPHIAREHTAAASTADNERRLKAQLVELAKDSLVSLEPMPARARVELLLEDHGVSLEHIDRVLAERDRLIKEHLEEDRRRVELAAASWRAVGAAPPELPLTETEIQWREAQGIEIPSDDPTVAHLREAEERLEEKMTIVAERMADYPADPDSQWLKTIPPERRQEALRRAGEIRRERLDALVQRNREREGATS